MIRWHRLIDTANRTSIFTQTLQFYRSDLNSVPFRGDRSQFSNYWIIFSLKIYAKTDAIDTHGYDYHTVYPVPICLLYVHSNFDIQFCSTVDFEQIVRKYTAFSYTRFYAFVCPIRQSFGSTKNVTEDQCGIISPGHDANRNVLLNLLSILPVYWTQLSSCKFFYDINWRDKKVLHLVVYVHNSCRIARSF